MYHYHIVSRIFTKIASTGCNMIKTARSKPEGADRIRGREGRDEGEEGEGREKMGGIGGGGVAPAKRRRAAPREEGDNL